MATKWCNLPRRVRDAITDPERELDENVCVGFYDGYRAALAYLRSAPRTEEK